MTDADLSEGRRATRRGQYLASTTSLTARAGEAVAWSEFGYSAAGVAKQMDTTAGTVKNYYSVAIARYGLEAVGAVYDGWDEEADLVEVTPAELEEYREGENGHRVFQQWVDHATSNREEVPDEALRYAAAHSPRLTLADGRRREDEA